MKKYIPILEKTQLFEGISRDEIALMLGCLQAKLCDYKKGDYVLRQGEDAGSIMILVDGELHIQCDDYWGNRSIISHVSVGDMFGEAYAISENATIMNDVYALSDSKVIFFDAMKVISVCSSGCRFHSMVVRNLFSALSQKNRTLVQKLMCMSRRSTRGKLISYLSQEATKHGSSEFSIPFNRQQLADYLSVDRSAMSSELCRMRDEGLIEFKKNRFILHQQTVLE